MTSVIITLRAKGPGLVLPKPRPFVKEYFNENNLDTPCEIYQRAVQYRKEDILIYFHDDVTVHDPDWHDRVMELFKNENCVAVGFGGATGLGNRDLYRKPFNIRNMARSGYGSNQTDAETHGLRIVGVHRVAVLDAFCMAIRREFLTQVGGWPVSHLSHHCLDLWLACEAERREKKIMTVGVSCTHHGGGTSTKASYANAKWLQGGTLESDHLLPHKWLWNEYRDVLPLEINNG